MKLNILLVFLLLLSVSCSNKSKKSQDNSAVVDAVGAEADDFVVDEEDQMDKGKNLTDDGATPEGELLEPNNDNPEKMNMAEDNSEIPLNAGLVTYSVKKGETLMMIAFRIYGDYSKWRSLSELNGGITEVRSGQEISYNAPSVKFEWNPEGTPYLIQAKDTLGSISKDKYGTTSKWKNIYDNNKPLIKDPNIIFAGFTIYYRDLASIANN